MGFIGAKTQRRAQTVDLAELSLPADDASWLEERLGTLQPKTTDIDALIDTLKDDPQHLALVRNLKSAIIGGQRTLPGGVAVHKDGHTPVDTVATLLSTLAHTPRGEPEAVTRVRDGMPDALWGHEDALDQFCRWAKDHISEARLTPAVMAIVGDAAHGKDEALQQFATLVGTAKSRLLTVDLSTVTDKDLPFVFGDDAPLDIKALKLRAARKDTVVHLTGMDSLQQRAPKVAQKLTELLLARRGEPNFAALPYALDFNQPAQKSPRELVNAALGAPGNRVLSAVAAFDHLDAQVMARYATERYLPRLLSARGLGNLTLKWEPDALAVLGRMLATPAAPLDELEHRLLRFVLTHVDTQVFDRKQAVLSARLSPTMESDARKREALVTAMQAPAPDLFEGEKMFTLPLVGRRFDPAARDAMLAETRTSGAAIDDASATLLAALPEENPELEALADTLMQRFGEHRALIDQILRSVGRREQLSAESLVRDKEMTLLQASTQRIEEALGAYEEVASQAFLLIDDNSALAAPEVACEQIRAGLGRTTATFLALAGNETASQVGDVSRLLGPSQALEGHTRFCTQVVLSADGKTIASASGDGDVRVWDAVSGAPLAKLNVGEDPVYALAISPDGKSVAAGDAKNLQLWSVDTQTKAVFEGQAAVTAVAFSPDGAFLVSGQEDGTLNARDVTDASAPQQTFKPHSDMITALVFSPDGTSLATASGDKTIHVLESGSWADRTAPLEGHGKKVTGLSFSRDGRLLASSSEDKSVRIWDASTGASVGAPLTGHSKTVNAISFAPDGAHVFSGSDDESIRVWNLNKGEATMLPKEHTSAVRSLVLNADGTLLASASNDQSVRLWRFAATVKA